MSMGRPSAILEPKRVTINGGQVSYLVRVPQDLRAREKTKDGRKYFPTQAVAQGYCNRLKSDLRNYSDKARGLSDAQKIEAQECFDLLAASPGASMTDAVKEYLVRREQAGRSVTVEVLGKTFHDTRKAIGGRGSRERTLQEVRTIWAKFEMAFPGRLANSITPEEVNDWLTGLMKMDRRTGLKTDAPVSLQTRRNFRRVVHSVFAFAKERVRRWVAENPVSDVKLPRSHKHQVVLLPVPKVRQMFEVSPPELVPYLALLAFAGLRPIHTQKFPWSQIHFDRGEHGEIEIPQGTDKTDPARIIPMQPNLRDLLMRTPEAERVGTVFYERDAFEEMRDALRVKPWPADCLRHDFATYRIKMVGSFGQVADEMGNSETVIRDRYFGSVSKSDAEAFWSIGQNYGPPVP